MERMLAQILREGGARVRLNQFVRDLNVPVVSVQDQRRIEVIAEGLSLYRGKQIAIDTTLVSPLSTEGALGFKAIYMMLLLFKMLSDGSVIPIPMCSRHADVICWSQQLKREADETLTFPALFVI